MTVSPPPATTTHAVASEGDLFDLEVVQQGDGIQSILLDRERCLVLPV